MPLPDAEETATYERIQTKTIQYPIGNFSTDSKPTDKLSQEDFQIVKNQVRVMSSNEDEMRRLGLIGAVANQSSTSGAFRLIHVTGELTEAGYVHMIPDLPGQYSLQALDAVVAGGSGTQTYSIYYGSPTDDNVCFFYYIESSDSNVAFTSDANWNLPMVCDQDLRFVMRLNSVGSGITKVTFNMILAQIR